MGDGRSDVGYVSFIVIQLGQTCFGMMFGKCFGICLGDVLIYVHMYMDVNTTMRYVIKLQ